MELSDAYCERAPIVVDRHLAWPLQERLSSDLKEALTVPRVSRGRSGTYTQHSKQYEDTAHFYRAAGCFRIICVYAAKAIIA